MLHSLSSTSIQAHKNQANYTFSWVIDTMDLWENKIEYQKVRKNQYHNFKVLVGRD